MDAKMYFFIYNGFMIYLEFNLKDNRQFPFITTKAQKQIGLIEE